jgi:uncharacterized membrane protein
MPDWTTLSAIFAIGAVSLMLRIGGYLTAGSLPPDGRLAKLIRLAPGNMLVAFVAAGVLEGGWPYLAGSLTAATIMAATRKEWAALSSGFAAVAAVAALL